MSLWKYLPYWALFVLARLQTMPVELHEAAEIDGANGVAAVPVHHAAVDHAGRHRSPRACAASGRSTSSTWCSCRRGGGPLSETTTIPVLIRRIAWEQNDIGYAAAVAMAMLIMVAVLTNFYFWVYRRAEKRLA